MASKMGNLKQYADREVVTKTDFNNLCAEMSGDPIIGHEIATGNRSDSDLGDVNSGVTGHIIKDIYQREGKKFKIVDSSGKIIKVIDLNDLEEGQFGILAGKSKASGFPDFLLAGGGVNKYFTILGAATKLEMVVDGVAYDLEADVQSNVLGLAPAANNTCLVNDTATLYYQDRDITKTIGEYGFWIVIDTVGSEITALNNTIQCFKLNNGTTDEVFTAKIDTTNSKLIPIRRGIGGTKRIIFKDNDTITLLKGHYIFLDDNLTTIDTTINYPKWQEATPAGPASGDYWFKTSERIWYRYSGAAWEKLGRIYLGYGICDSIGCLWVEHEDYSLLWEGILGIPEIISLSNTDIKIKSPIELSVAGKRIIHRTDKTLTMPADLEGGLAELASTWYYIYITSAGNFYLSDEAPRIKDFRYGYYHPHQYWRCIGFFYNSATSNIELMCFHPNTGYGNFNDINILISRPSVLGSYKVVYSLACGILTTVNTTWKVTHGAAPAASTIDIKSLSNTNIAINLFTMQGPANTTWKMNGETFALRSGYLYVKYSGDITAFGSHVKSFFITL